MSDVTPVLTDGTYIRSKAPLRLSFSGGGTDIEAYYRGRRGAVLVTTINKYCFVTLRGQANGHITIRSLDFDLSVQYRVDEKPRYDGVLDLGKAVMAKLGLKHGVELTVESEAPAGSGLGGSSALATAVLAAVLEVQERRVSPYELAELAYTIERVDLKISGGRQDQYSSVFGGFNLIEFSDAGTIVNPLRIAPDVLNDLERHCLLCYTGRTRLSAGLIDTQVQFYQQERKETMEGMATLFELTYRMKDHLLRGRLRDFGDLLHEAFAAKKRANPAVTDGWLDEMYEAARAAGALGGKITGAGLGGYILFFVENGKRHAVRKKLTEMGAQVTEFDFEPGGVQTWRSSCP